MEGRALSPDVLCRDSEEPVCRGGVLPDEEPGTPNMGPGTLARNLSRRAPRERSEWRGCMEGTPCPDEQSETGAHFLPSWYKFYCVLVRSRYKFDRSHEFIPGIKLVAGTGAVSQYNLSRSQKLVKVQNFNCVQMRVSGCKNHYEFVLGAGVKAKIMTTCTARRETTYPYCPCYGLGIFIFIGDRKVPRNASLYILIKTNIVNVIRK